MFHQILNQLDMEWKSISKAEDRELKDVLVEFSDVFVLDPMEFGQTGVVQHHGRTYPSKAASEEDIIFNESNSGNFGGDTGEWNN